jgi:hypothetical protein
MGPKEQNDRFLYCGSNNFDRISVNHGYHRPKQNCVGGIFRNVMESELGAQMRNVSFLRSGMNCGTDFALVPYLRVNRLFF